MNNVLYCPKCKTLLPDTAQQCEKCQGGVRAPQPEDFVLLAAGLEFEINNLCAALSDRDIAFREETEDVSVFSYRSRGFRGNSSVFVQHRDYAAAKEAARGFGISFPESDAEDDAVSAPAAPATAGGEGSPAAGQRQKGQPEEDAGRKKLGKVLLYLSVLAAIVAVVFLSDTVIGWFRGLFH